MYQDAIRLNARIVAAASVVGKKEREGPLGECFDLHDPADRFGAGTWEDAESEMQRLALSLALKKSAWHACEADALFAGDLLNQCVGSAYGLASFDVPYFGLYGACSTCAEAILLAAMAVLGGGMNRTLAVTSSHYCAAERQFRTPVEYGGQRPPTAQWTVTGAGAFALEGATGQGGSGVFVTRGMVGKVVDAGIRDLANMGAAMAPAALDTLTRFFAATGMRESDYDGIVTGDLGYEGGDIFCELLASEGILLGKSYADCGRLIYQRQGQDVHAGGSGCGCSAVVLASYLLPRLQRGEWKRFLFLATGAMMSPDSIKQGKSIPAVAHLLEIEIKG